MDRKDKFENGMLTVDGCMSRHEHPRSEDYLTDEENARKVFKSRELGKEIRLTNFIVSQQKQGVGFTLDELKELYDQEENHELYE